METSSETIVGSNKTIEIDESLCREYNKGRPAKVNWVFGAVERESGRTFLVPV